MKIECPERLKLYCDVGDAQHMFRYSRHTEMFVCAIDGRRLHLGNIEIWYSTSEELGQHRVSLPKHVTDVDRD